MIINTDLKIIQNDGPFIKDKDCMTPYLTIKNKEKQTRNCLCKIKEIKKKELDSSESYI